MLIGLLMIVAPAAVFVLSIPLTSRFKPMLRKVYLIVAGVVVFLGSGVSIYLASYTGDQGGIAAYFFQILVIFVYAAFSVALAILNWILPDK
ncbi:MAG: hypothetical protein ACR2QT_06725 [Woeseiaceae bacterium]